MGNKIIKFLFIVLFSFIFCDDTNSKLNFTVNSDRVDIIPGEYIKLVFDINIAPGYFIYSTNPEKSLSATEIVWSKAEENFYINAKESGISGPIRNPYSNMFVDTSFFFEPTPKIKYDPNFEMEVGYHENQIILYQYFLTSKELNQYSDLDKINGELFYQVCEKYLYK